MEQIADHVAIIDGGKMLVCGGLDDLKMHYQRLSLVCLDEPPSDVGRIDGVVSVRRSGRMLSILVSRNVEAVAARLRQLPGVTKLLIIVSAIIAAFQLRKYAATRPSDASTGASLRAFHIAELQRRRDLLRSIWRWIVAPIMISIWVILAGFVQARPASAGPLLTFGCVMTVIGLVLSLANIRGARRLQRDIDDRG